MKSPSFDMFALLGPLLILALMKTGNVVEAIAYPVGISNCGISSWIKSTPSRALTMNQGTTEIMLALGLADRMVGSAYLDDEIWQELAADYAKVPVISPTYPTAAEIEALQPDFVYASYSSAFATSSVNYTKRLGGFLDVVDCSLTIPRPDGTNRTHCRQELHDYGIQTYLQEPFCEKVELRPETLTLDVLRAEIGTIATIFDVLEQGRAIVTSMEDHFEQARVVSSGGATATDAPKLRVRLYCCAMWCVLC
jgi:iron complex transport system substrate-binding protein